MDGFLFTISTVLLWVLTKDRHKRFYHPMILTGIFIGMGFWIKSTAIILVLFLILGLVRLVARRRLSIFQSVSYFILSMFSALVIVVPLILRKDIGYIFREPGSFVLPISELVKLPVGLWISNFIGSLVSLILYFNPLIIMAVIISLFTYKKRINRFLTLWFILPYLIIILIGNTVLIRYIVVATVTLIPLLANSLSMYHTNMKRQYVTWIIWIVLIVYGIFFTVKPVEYYRLFPQISPEPSYALSWPSGYGIPELTNWINDNVPPGKTILLAVADSPGNPSDYFLAYYHFHPSVNIFFATLTNEHELRRLEPLTQKTVVYLATRSTLITPDIQKFLYPVQLFPKPYSAETVGIYRISFSGIPNPL